MTSTTLEPSRVPPDRLAHRLSLGRRAVEARAALPHGAFGAMGGMLTSVSRPGPLRRRVPRRAWPPRDGARDRTDRARRCARCSRLARVRQRLAVAAASRRRRCSSTPGGYGYGLGVTQNCDFRDDRRAQRRAAGVRLADALAAGVRRRHHRVRQPDLHGLGPRRPARRSTRSRRPAACSRARSQPSPALVAARDAVSQLIVRWDDALADSASPRSISFSIDRRTAAAHEHRAICVPTGRRLCRRRDRLRRRRERAARPVDDDLRARQAAGRDHAGADDAADRAVPERAPRARDGGVAEHVRRQSIVARYFT